MYQPLIARNQAEHQLYRLQAEWRAHSSPKARQAIAGLVAEHPEWGIAISEDGPILQTSSQSQQN